MTPAPQLLRTFAAAAVAALSAVAAPPPAAAASPAAGTARDGPAGDKLVVHEWGTFTALQDERGRTIKGINTDDEPLPAFVHDAHGFLMQQPGDLPPVQFKGVSRVHPDVYVRLETPVLYFYPPRSAPKLKLDVEVKFNGGWLTQFYPDAKAVNPRLTRDRVDVGPLTTDTVSSLAWTDLTVAGTANGPRTDSRVWLAPREVSAASVRTPAGEAERYLFYRGVARIDPPVRVVREAGRGDDPAAGDRLSLFADRRAGLGDRVGPLWLVDVRHDGAVAFRTIAAAEPNDGARPVATTPAAFAARDYAADHLAGIRAELKAALVRDGLFADEADAMMNTWEASYFKRPGLRVFFMVPRAWTDAVLPLSVRAGGLVPDMAVERAMIGRIELVTPGQRDRLRRIGAAAPADGGWLGRALEQGRASQEDKYRETWFRQLMTGERSLLGENIRMPDEFRDYLELGRFRNALILDEQARRPNPNLATFVRQYDLEYSQVPAADPEIREKTAGAKAAE